MFNATISGDPVSYPPADKSRTYIDYARTIRHLASMGEVIDIYGPKGLRRFRASYPVGILKAVPLPLSQMRTMRP